MKKLKRYLTIVLLVYGLQGFSQQAEAWLSADSSSIMIGDQIGVNLGIKLPAGSQVQWPLIGDTLTANIHVVKKENIDTITDAQKLTLQQHLVITSFDSGYFEVPPLHILYRLPNDTAVFDAVTGSFFLQVFVPDVDTTKPFKVIKGPVEEPYTFAEIFPWILLGLLVIAAIVFLIIYLNRRKKNQPLFKSKPKPLPPPDVEAIRKLEELRLARVWQSGKVKQYHSSLTDIMKNYLKRRFGFDAPEMTSDEILDELKVHNINQETTEKLKGVMQLADLVKFAKAQPTPLENDLSLEHCIDFVKETKPVVETQDENEKLKLSDKKENK
jgi:hypothetical protein